MKTVEQLYEELRAAADNGHESMTHEDALTCVRSMHEATATTPRAVQTGEPAGAAVRAACGQIIKILAEIVGAGPTGEYPALPESELSAIDTAPEWDVNPHYEQVSDAHRDDLDVVNFYTADQMRAYGEACWKAGYKHGAWAAQPAGAQQPGAAGLVDALEDAQRAINSMKVEAETAAQGDEQMMLEACETVSNEGFQADMAIRAALAAHGQAPAQPAPILYGPKTLLSIFQTAQAGSSSTAGTLRGIAAVIASWESRPDPHTWLIAAPQSSPAAQGDAVKQLGWVYCYQGQEPAFSYTPQPPGIPKTHYWQVPVFDVGRSHATQEHSDE